MLEVLEGNSLRWRAVEGVDRGVREREQNGRVRSDHELTALADHVLHQCHEPELGLRRQRSLRLIEEVQSARHEPRLKKREEALPVRAAIQVATVLPVHRLE